jgi:predicted phage terminase large subunit-like protein
MSARPTEQQAFDALLRQRLAPFIRKTFSTVDPGTTYLHNWHVDLIAEYLEACTRREITRLIINIPPRYLKSIAVSVAWPDWLLGKDPSSRIMAASYSKELALRHSTDARLVLKSDWYNRIFPGTVLVDDQDTKAKFVTTQRGMRYATSVGGTATGEGGDYLIVDDPLNPTEALSSVQRETANTWFDQTFSTRLNDKEHGVIVLVMQRLHANDLTDHLLAKGGWEHLCIPAIAETKTIIDFGRIKRIREAGEVLHAARESPAAIEKQKLALGSYGFAGQYQQRPAPAGGGMFKATWFSRYAKSLDVYEQIVQSWDTASKPGQLNDPSCCTTWGIRKDGYDLLQVISRRLEYPQLKALAISQAHAFAPTAILIEDKSSGQALIQDLRLDTTLPIIAINPVNDKITRASAISATFEAGKVALPTHAAWLTDYEMEMLTFPNAPHDDAVDSTSQFITWANSKARASIPNVRSL